MKLVPFLLCFSCSMCKAFNEKDYPRFQILSPRMKIFWRIDGISIHLAIQASARGWVAFGISETGGMKGADIVYIESSRDVAVDSFSFANSQPRRDQKQDWSLISQSVMAGKMTVELSRALNTHDSEDNAITDDSWPAIDGTRIIAAWGDSNTVQYHGADNVITTQVRFFRPPPEDPLERIRSDPEVRSFTFAQRDVPIPTRPTSYDHQCVPLSAALGGPVDAAPAAKQHIVALEYLADPDANSSAPAGTAGRHTGPHHLVMSCFRARTGDAADTWSLDYLRSLAADPTAARAAKLWPVPRFPSFFTGTICAYDQPEDDSMLWGWAPGNDLIVAPGRAGFPVLGDSGCDYLMLQAHYDNAARVAGRRVSWGVRVYYRAPAVDGPDIGLFSLGDPTVALYGKVLAAGRSKQAFRCGGLTTALPPAGVTVFNRGMHMHRTGERMVTRQFRGKELLRVDSVEFFDFDQTGAINPTTTGPGFQVKPGDWWEVDCYYRTDSLAATESAAGLGAERRTRWGLGSDDEMCIDFVYYYPRQKLADHQSCTINGSLGGAYIGETCLSPMAPATSGLAAARRAADADIRAFYVNCTQATTAQIVTAPDDRGMSGGVGPGTVIGIVSVLSFAALIAWAVSRRGSAKLLDLRTWSPLADAGDGGVLNSESQEKVKRELN